MRLDVTIPTSWAEIPSAKLVQVARLFDAAITRPAFLVKAFFLLSGLRPLFKTPVGHHYYISLPGRRRPVAIDRSALTEAANRCEFLLQPVNDLQCPLFSGFDKYLAPKQRLYNLTVEQFLYAELAAAAYEKSKDQAFLHKLMAALWIPKAGFQPQEIDRHAKRFARLDPAVHLAAHLFYTGARRYLAGEFPHVFQPGGDDHGDYDVTSMLRELNGGDITRNPRILESQLWDALKQLEDMGMQVEMIKNRKK